MALLRYLAPAALVLTLMAGCSQSLFDDLSDDDDDGDPDGSVARPDARPGDPDGGPGPGRDSGPDEPDGGIAGPDAGPRAECPEPCAGDAYGEFKNEQGGLNGRWRYIEVRPEAMLEDQYVDMVVNFFPGAVLGWRGVGTPPPAIALCVAVEPAPPCLDLRGFVALATSVGPDAHRPALLWTPSEPGSYRVTGSWVGSSRSESVAFTLTFTRNDEGNVLETFAGSLTTTPQTFELMVPDLVAGETIVLSASTSSNADESIGVELFITGPIRR